MHFSKSETSPFLNSYTDNEEMKWKANVYEFIKDFRASYAVRFKKMALNLLLVLSSVLVTSYVDPSFIQNINRGFSSFSKSSFI